MGSLSRKTSFSLFLCAAASIFSAASYADHVYICKYLEAVREIHVSYEQEGQAVPCEVLYRKADGEQVLWSAQAEEGYCEQKAEAFVEKQRGWGWSCEAEHDEGAGESAALEESAEDASESAGE